MSFLVIATWEFALPGLKEAAQHLADNGSCLDAVEHVVKTVELNPDVESVGLGGFPNKEGVVELDAAIMRGKDLGFGAVVGVRQFIHPISIARKVMSDTPYCMLVGTGAEDFAQQHGFQKGELLTDQRRQEWLERKQRKSLADTGHDTIGVIALDLDGSMACGTSSSGLKMKHPGRVGDSPIIGAGLYADDDVGAAVATGVGEDIMRCCLCFYAVELMQQGKTPQQAAEATVTKAHTRLARTQKKIGNIALVCADNKGACGAAANHEGFGFCVASSDMQPRFMTVEPISSSE
ncbi:MAG: N(4)-(beta-N-acetylglucosaminyl)-L-asparaginase [candidate division WOR-3 bacterium]|nr:MAG: N(4)-(beta-N-acetylglucosaminyl)-L-asparaginase [candidate division WOR-3 bacterium]